VDPQPDRWIHNTSSMIEVTTIVDLRTWQRVALRTALTKMIQKQKLLRLLDALNLSNLKHEVRRRDRPDTSCRRPARTRSRK
jgi:hypothetical protein